MRKPNTQGERTREKILNVAEALFSESGLHGVSVRDISERAGVQLALINYHFQTKENLFYQVMERRVSSISRARFAQPDAARAAAPDAVATAEQIVAAFIDPVFDELQSGDRGWKCYARLIAQVSTDQRYSKLVDEFFNPTAAVFLQALRTAFPKVPAARLQWSYLFMVGAMVQTIAQTDRIRQLSGGKLQPDDFEAARRELRKFLARSFGA
jgi:AcrR family transcriptional regulator